MVPPGGGGGYELVTLATSADIPDAVTVSDTPSVDLTLTGQDISAAVLPAGVDHNSLANLTVGDPHTQYVEKAGDAMTGSLVIHNGFDLGLYADAGSTLRWVVDGNAGSQSMSGNLSVNGNTTLGNAAGDTLTVTATPTFAQDATFQQDITVNGNATLGDNATDVVNVAGESFFLAPATFGDDLTVNGDTILGNAASDNVTINGHLVGPSTGPSIAVEAAAGTGASAVITGNDNWGAIDFTTGTGVGTGEMFTVTFGVTKPDTDYGVILFARDADAASAGKIYAHGEAADHWDMNIATVALADSTLHQWTYLVVEY